MFIRNGSTLLCLAAAAVLAAALLASPRAGAIVIRHDRDDARYRELGANYPAVAQILPEGAAGVLIAPQWVLTAAHVGGEMVPFDMRVRLGEREVPIEKIIVHPDWTARRGAARRDIALLKLAEPVNHIEPVLLYDRDDEAGQQVVFVGWGMTGDGREAPKTDDGVKRGAQNRVEHASPTSVTFRFDAPPGGEELEGISGPGDSGGPALVERAGRVYTVGVSSSNSGGDEDHCTYGTIETYARVSTARQWIEQTIAADPPATMAWAEEVKLPEAPANAGDGLPDSPLGRAAGAWLTAHNRLDAEAAWAFEQSHCATPGRESENPAPRLEQLRRRMERFGTVTPLGFVSAGEDAIAVRMRAEKTGQELAVLIFPDASRTGRIRLPRLALIRS